MATKRRTKSELLTAAAKELLAAVEDNHRWHLENDEHCGYEGSELETVNLAVIAKATGKTVEQVKAKYEH